MKTKGEFNFALLFSIIVGAMILVLAIYGVVKLSGTQRYKIDTETAKKISILTDPLQAGFAEGSFGKISFKSETKLNNFCFDNGFGENRISTATRSGVGEEWQIAGAEISIPNKYIFSSPSQTGAEYYVFSKPFYFPYKIADLIFLTTEDYCFVSPPEEVEDEVTGLNIPNIRVGNCSERDVKVCFGSTAECDVSVYGIDFSYETGKVIKPGGEMFYAGSLLYGAIFSSPEIYECNVNRLMQRCARISEVFAEKVDLMNGRGCNSNLKPDLIFLGGLTVNASSENLISNYQIAEEIDRKNKLEKQCGGLW